MVNGGRTWYGIGSNGIVRDCCSIISGVIL